MRNTLLIAAALAFASPALACSCAPGSLETQVEYSYVIFIGEAGPSTSAPEGQIATRFRVIEMLKGEPAAELTIRHFSVFAPCDGIAFVEGSAPIVIMANRFERGDDRGLYSGACNMPRGSETDLRDALKLSAPEKPVSPQ